MLSERNVGVVISAGVVVVIMVAVIGLGLVMDLNHAGSGMARPAEIVIIPGQPNPNPYHRQYEEMLYPVVRIETPEGVGSGVVIESMEFIESKESNSRNSMNSTDSLDFYILTAAHVVGNYSSVTVTLYTPLTPLNRGELSAFVAMTDTVKDLALLATDTHGLTRIFSAKLAPKDYTPYLFTPVWTVGCSLGLAPRPSSGQICAICGSYWEVSSPILPGNSGGGVFDARTNELIGIAVWVHTYNGQLITTMAGVIPINQVYEFLEPVCRRGRSIESKGSDSKGSINSSDSIN